MGGPPAPASVACFSGLPSLVRHVELHVHNLFCKECELRPLLDACGLGGVTQETSKERDGWAKYGNGCFDGAWQAVTKVA